MSSAKELRANADECLDRDKATWRIVAKDLKEAAAGGDPAEVLLALRMVLSLEGSNAGRSDAALLVFAHLSDEVVLFPACSGDAL